MAAGKRKDYYATLGVPRNAKRAAVRKAYRHLARRLHPDVNPGDSAAESRFKEVREAYDVLSDEKKREFYDRHGFYSDQARNSGAGAGRPGGFGFDGFDFNDFPGQGGAGPDLGSVFESVFGGHRRQRRHSAEPMPGEDIEYGIDIGFDDAIHGSTVRLKVDCQGRCSACGGSGTPLGSPPRQCAPCGGSGQAQTTMGNMRFNVACPTCGGQGVFRTPCGPCAGEGRVRVTRNIELGIPPGTGENSRLRVPSKGNAGVRGGAAGDLYVVAHVGTHPFFERKGFDIYIRLPITPAEAILGAKIKVPTINGAAILRIPPATSSGKTFRVRERGVKNPRTGKRGDQFVRISIVVPEIPDETTKDLMRRYATRNPENPREAILEAC